MRRLLFIMVLFSSIPAGTWAQSDSNLVSRYRPGIMWFYTGFRPAKTFFAPRYDRLVFDLLYNDWVTDKQKAFQSHISSIGFNTQLFFDIPLTPKNIVSIGIGLGYGHSRIRYDQLLSQVTQPKSTVLIPFPDSDYEKSVFKTNKLFIPVELRFRTPGWQHFKFQIGGRIGYQFAAKSKVFKENSVIKTRNLYDLNPLLFSVHARVGIRNWAITASYNISPYFKNAKSTQINGLEIGLSVSLF